ncbi:MAG: hypothetical protein MJD61_22545 [Proteobacteria bacterium]|nr:hypothetical protein [Pseudomonadota bacterium]
MRELATAAVTSLRLGMHGSGSAALARLVDQLAGRFAQRGKAAFQPELLGLLRALLEAQQAADYLRLADLLEHELMPRLAHYDAGDAAAQGKV